LFQPCRPFNIAFLIEAGLQTFGGYLFVGT
jgi:hypothetical protein